MVSELAIAYAAISPFVFLELAITVWYHVYWVDRPRDSVARTLCWLVFVGSLFGTPIVQIELFRWIIGKLLVNDIVIATICAESLLSIGIGFYLMLKSRKKEMRVFGSRTRNI